MIKNGSTTVATGTVTQANMKLSLAVNNAFVDFNSSSTLTPYVNDQLIITDSSAHQLTGYINATGTGETYGSQLLSNTTLTTTSGWTGINTTLAAVTSTCHSLNCLKSTDTNGAGSGQAFSSLTVSTGALLRASAWMNSGTDSGFDALKTENATSFDALNTVYQSGTWASQTFYSTNEVTGTSVWLNNQFASGTVYLDTPSVTQVLTPSTTGVTIVSTQGISNVWQHSFTPEISASHPWVFFNGVAGGINGGNPQASSSAL